MSKDLLSVFTIRSTVLTDNKLRHLRVWLADVYRVLQSFFIFPHLVAPSFPWPWIVGPDPIAGIIDIRHKQWAALGFIGLNGIVV